MRPANVPTRVLIITDESARQAADTDAFAKACPDWELTWVNGLAAAQDYLRGNTGAVVICDVQQTQTTGAQIINEISRAHPRTARMITGEVAEKEMISQFILAPHHFLPKPLEPVSMRAALIRALSLERWIGSDEMRTLLAGVRTFPAVPSHYLEVLKELRAEEPAASRVGEIIASDMAMYTKILQVLNSPYYGFARRISNPTEAVTMLGFEMVKSLVLSIQVFSQFNAKKLPVADVENVWRHSTRVAQAARKVAIFEHADRRIVDDAFTAGLMHDIGKLILVSDFGAKYRETQDIARNSGEPLSRAEKNVFGVTHGEISAYLLILWGMPLTLGEAVAYHHYPSRSEDAEFTALSALHAADALVREVDSEPGLIYLSMDEPYLSRIGLTGRTETWRNLLEGRPASNSAPATPPPAPAKSTAAEIPQPAEPTPSSGGLVKRLAFWKRK